MEIPITPAAGEEFVNLTRSAAIKVLEDMQADFDDEECDENFAGMTNEELECELCMSGIIHDSDFGMITEG